MDLIALIFSGASAERSSSLIHPPVSQQETKDDSKDGIAVIVFAVDVGAFLG